MPQVETSTPKNLLPDILNEFQNSNPHCKLTYLEDDKKILLEKLWNSESIKVILDIEEFDKINDLNNVIIDPKFDAIIHKDTNQIEFIYRYIDPGNEIQSQFLTRKFDFFFNGEKFSCEFKEPTDRLLLLARGFYKQSTNLEEFIVPQLVQFRDSQFIKSLPSKLVEYFQVRVPRNFFISSSKSIVDVDIVDVAKHLNIIMRYYDRQSPLIVIHEENEKEANSIKKPKRFIENKFPDIITITDIDDFLLQLLNVAENTTPRFAFVYYYQVIEYVAFYYVDNKAKKELRRLLRNPTINECRESDLSQIIAFLAEKNDSDDVKMQKVIEDCCDPSVLWREIENDKEFFSNQILFEGDVIIPALIANDTTEDTWKTMCTPKLQQYLAKIRNAIVHAREKRQNNVIFPSDTNTVLISQILPIIRRVAEMISLMKE
ncbi:hypothetical protein SDC9_58797 [bioreactor metagenome]|uniref:Uncharacterized protein n=1 Tax=bioreactor metagenome TaxID=1076179 RepID=A0A644XE31_9ZZZZ